MPSPPVRTIHVWTAACLTPVVGGWLLSALHRLNAVGWTVFLAVAVLAAGAWAFRTRRAWGASLRREIGADLRSYLRDWPGRIFLGCLVVSLAGGLLNLPLFGDAMVYRLPRVFHWLAAGQWHWIPKADDRLNGYGANIEWMHAPFLALGAPLQLLFLPNVVCFALLPKATARLLRGLGAQARGARLWGLVFAGGWVFAMQAGSIGNDLYGSFWAIGGLGEALLAARRRRATGLGWSLVAMGLAIGTKHTFIPLGLAWFLAVVRRLPDWLRITSGWRIGVTAITFLAISPAWIVAGNLRTAGHWLGYTRDQSIEPAHPVPALLANSAFVILHNLQPPVIPWDSRWNAAVKSIEQGPRGYLFDGFERFGHLEKAWADYNAGAGPLLLLLIAAGTAASLIHRRRLGSASPWARGHWPVKAALVLAAVAHLAKCGSHHLVRSFAVHHITLGAILLAGWLGRGCGVNRGWRLAATLHLAATFTLLVFSRQRPAWPVAETLNFIADRTGKPSLQKAADRFNVIRRLGADLQATGSVIPAAARHVGYVAGGNTFTEPWLWRALPEGGSIDYVLATDSAEFIRSQSFDVIVVDSTAFDPADPNAVDRWLGTLGGAIQAERTYSSDGSQISRVISAVLK